MVISSLISTITKRLQKHREVILHSTGAANYKALKVAAIIQEQSKGTIVSQIYTNTIHTTSFQLPTNAGEQREKREKNINGVTIQLAFK